MARLSVVEEARTIAQEIASYLPDCADRHAAANTILMQERLQNGRRYAAAHLASLAYDYSHTIIEQAIQPVQAAGPSSALTCRTLAMTALASTGMRPQLAKKLDNCCFAAELKYIHSLELHGQPPGQAELPWNAALVLYDADDEPLAYQKTIGHAYAYVWRDGIVRTVAGLRSLMAGSIVRPRYGQTIQRPHRRFAGAGLVGIAGCIADDIEFKRFGLELLPKRLRRSAFLEATGPGTYDEYRDNIDEGVAMNSTLFGERIIELIKNSRSYSVQRI